MLAGRIPYRKPLAMVQSILSEYFLAESSDFVGKDKQLLVFDSSSSAHQVTLDIVQDNANELTESFSVILEMDSATEPGVLLIPGNSFVTILDDDSKPLSSD